MLRDHGNAAWIALLLLGALPARADVVLLLEEPMGKLWSMEPAHSAIYLPRVCATTPVSLRRCQPGEEGAVISRYHRIEGYDWVAVPLTPYLYGVDRGSEIPVSVNAGLVSDLREQYRKNHLQSLAPEQSGPVSKDWPQLAGEAYDRSIYAFILPTTEQLDDAIVRMLNGGSNHNRFNIVYRNCADFAREIIDFFYPGAVYRSALELGIATPQEVARDLVRFARRRGVPLSVYKIPQVPGTLRRSKPMRNIPAISSAVILNSPLENWPLAN